MTDMTKMDFMQYPNEPDVAFEHQRVLSSWAQFYSSTADFTFLAKLRSGKASRKEREEWFLANERRSVWFVAQGILASVYGEDPP